MKAANSFVLVMVTTPSLVVARKLAGAALDQRLIACANVLPHLESHYRWKGKREMSQECLMILKTRQTRLTQLEKLVLELHPYDTPEIITVPLESGTRRYLDWLKLETTSERPKD